MTCVRSSNSHVHMSHSACICQHDHASHGYGMLACSPIMQEIAVAAAAAASSALMADNGPGLSAYNWVWV